MINLLKIEWLKIKNYTAFKVMAIFFGVGIILANYAAYAMYNNIRDNAGEDGVLLKSFNPYCFESTWQTTTYASGFLLALPAMLLIMLLTNEYMFRTNRQNIIDGWSRKEFISVKLVMALIFAIVSTVLVAIFGFAMGLISKTEIGFHSFSHIGYFFLKALTYNFFAILISVLVKKTGFAMGIFIIYLGAENFASQALNALGYYLQQTKNIHLGSLGNYLPINAADALITFPENPLSSMGKKAFATDYNYVIFAFAIVYIILFAFWSRQKYIKADL